MKKVLITGSSGTIGTVLVKRLSHRITPFDLPSDVRDYAQLLRALTGHDCVVHLAWNTRDDNWQGGKIDTNNTLGTANVLQAAVASDVRKGILASSVHADRYADRNAKETRWPRDVPEPDSPYGAHKCFVKSIGRYYARYMDLVVVCIRFGGVYKEDAPPPHSPSAEKSVWLSHEDCVSLVDKALEVDPRENVEVLYGISDNPGRIQDLRNTIGWRPRSTPPLSTG